MRINNTYDLLAEAEIIPKPKKLITRDPKQEDELVIAGQTPRKKSAMVKLDLSLLNLPNVTVSEKRILKQDREKKIGRWKVTQEELEVRRLI